MRFMIVESPAKARRIASFLGDDWVVRASVGHVLDLPAHELGVDPQTYAPLYIASDRGKSVLKGLKSLAGKAGKVYLATDPDREGEAISAHLLSQLRLKDYSRVTFQEITETAVRQALEAPRKIDERLVAAQEARRVMDRLIGYKVSPVLSANRGQKLSAGRCQSPAIRLVVDRQREIETFVPKHHFTAEVSFSGGQWRAQWMCEALNPDEALAASAAACRDFTVVSCTVEEEAAGPPAPFTTSTLLQTASERLNLSTAQVQALAQTLFEGGHITYHRTDSPHIDEQAAAPIRTFAEAQGLACCKTSRQWRVAKGAQESHGAIRPTRMDTALENVPEPARPLYGLVHCRALASQLEDARFQVVVLRLGCRMGDHTFEFTARGRTLTSKGWHSVMDPDPEPDAESGAGQAENDGQTGDVPVLEPGAMVHAEDGKVNARQTRPPKPFTEASLIKKLETLGIGRPSTYASIITRILDCGHIRRQNRNLVAEPSGAAIADALTGHFSFLDYAYTSALEERLDHIATGTEGFRAVVADLDHAIEKELKIMTQQTAQYPCPSCSKPLVLIQGKNGPFWGCTGYKEGCTVTCQDHDGKPGDPGEHGREPTEKAIAFAQKLAGDSGMDIPAEALASAHTLSAFIDEALKKQPPRPASDKQKEFVKSLVERLGIEPPDGGIETLTMKSASDFIDSHRNGPPAAPM